MGQKMYMKKEKWKKRKENNNEKNYIKEIWMQMSKSRWH